MHKLKWCNTGFCWFHHTTGKMNLLPSFGPSPGKALPLVMKVRPGQAPLLTDSFTDVFPFIIRYKGEAKFNNWQLSGFCDWGGSPPTGPASWFLAGADVIMACSTAIRMLSASSLLACVSVASIFIFNLMETYKITATSTSQPHLITYAKKTESSSSRKKIRF